MKGRFAPSPTGRMHLGNVYSALLSWLSARSQGGGWILRIEDIDPQRSRPEYALQVKEDLRWLGLDWDEEYTQSQRSAIYEEYLGLLNKLGLTYPCYCTRADIMATQAPHESDGRIVYAGTCRPHHLTAVLQQHNNSHPEGAHKYNTEVVSESTAEDAQKSTAEDTQKSTAEGTQKSTADAFTKSTPAAASPSRRPSTRLYVPDEEISFTDAHYGPCSVNLARHCGDFILRRADGAWAYQLAVVVDDALMGITEVVRGRDLLLSAPQQIYLYRLWGFPIPTFCHLPLLCNASGQRLCKRDKSLDLGELRKHHTAEEVIGLLAHYAGLVEQPTPLQAKELVGTFSWEKVPTQDIITQSID